MEQIKTALVGLGRIASLLEEDRLREKPCTHAGAIDADPDCRLVAGADTDGERRRLFAERWNCPVYADAETMLRTHRPGILHIATHPDSHARYCQLAAALGVPVVVCEKPLADSIRDARRIAALHAGGKTVIVTNHERRYAADYGRARRILHTEQLGLLLDVRAVLYMGKNRRLLDALWHDGTHLADAIMFLSGRVMRHRSIWGAKLKSREGTAWLSGLLEKPSALAPGPAAEPAEPPSAEAGPIPFLIELGAGRDHLVFELEFSSERGRLRIGNGIFELWESGPSPYAEQFRSLKKTEEGFAGPTDYFANMVRDAVNCFRDPRQQPLSSAADGLRVIEYLNSVQRWDRGKKAPGTPS
ncbi:MAG: Gfo/Idh/MocA family oxidoreductase [Spirochaetaceae bacterium]|jgi:predicted dehydrogenase|nr:Gfo/Idh/MocA family oxidoreductase [Spirochaetaceae bacterium]